MDEVNVVTIDNERKYYGKASHASRPELGNNAFIIALNDLNQKYDLDKLYNDFSDY